MEGKKKDFYNTKSVLLSFDLHTYGEMHLAPDVRDFAAVPGYMRRKHGLQQLVLFEVGRPQSAQTPREIHST